MFSSQNFSTFIGLTSGSMDSTKPQAALNYILYNQQMQVVGSFTGRIQARTELEEIVSRNNAYESEMWQGISYGTYINELKKSYESNLSDKLLEDTLKLDLSKELISSMIESLKKQFESLTLIQKEIQIRLSSY